MTLLSRFTDRSIAFWLIPVLIAGLFQAWIVPIHDDLALQNDANYYLGGAASLAQGLGYRIEPYLDLPAVSQYPPLHSAWLAAFWRMGGGFPGNLAWMRLAMEGVSLAMLIGMALVLKRERVPFWFGSAFVLLVGSSSFLLIMTALLFSDLSFAMLGICLMAYVGPSPGHKTQRAGWWLGVGILLALLWLCRSAGLAWVLGAGLIWIFQVRRVPWKTGIALLLPLVFALGVKKWAAGSSGSYGDYFGARIVELGGWSGYLRYAINTLLGYLGGDYWTEYWFNCLFRLQLAKAVLQSPFAPIAHGLLTLLGIGTTGLMAYGLWLLRERAMARVWILVLAVYAAVLCAWPFMLGTRALLPLAPLAVVLLWTGYSGLPFAATTRQRLNPILLIFLLLNVAANLEMSRRESRFIRTSSSQQLAEIRQIASWLREHAGPTDWVAASRDVPLLHLRSYFGRRLLAVPTPHMKSGAFYDVAPAQQGSRTATFAVVSAQTPLVDESYTLQVEQKFEHYLLCRVIPR